MKSDRSTKDTDIEREGGGRCPGWPRNRVRVTRAQFLPNFAKGQVLGQVDGSTPSSITSPGPGGSSARAAARAQHAPPPIPLNLTQALTSDPALCPSPSPALRVILIEVGEQQLAGAGLSALARQVHGCARDGLGPPWPERARLNSDGPREHATLRIYVLSGWSPRSPPLAARGPTAASSRTHSCLCSRAGTGCALARSRPPSRRTAAYGAGPLRRPRLFTSSSRGCFRSTA